MKNKLQILVTVAFLGAIIWWISFQPVLAKQGISVQWYSATYGIMALIGAIIGLSVARKWGGFKTVLGKALMFFSIGLLAQEAGQLILAYYIYVSKIQIPYPSWGDVAYFTSMLSYLCGAIFLIKAVGIRFSLRNNKYKVVALMVPVILFAVSFAILLYRHEYDWHHPLTVFLDLGYPLGDATYISLGIIAFLLSRKMLGGVMRGAIVVLIIALSIQYIADFSFIYQNSRETYLSGGWVDLVYLISYFAMTTTMVAFYTVYRGLKKPKVASPPNDRESSSGSE